MFWQTAVLAVFFAALTKEALHQGLRTQVVGLLQRPNFSEILGMVFLSYTLLLVYGFYARRTLADLPSLVIALLTFTSPSAPDGTSPCSWS